MDANYVNSRTIISIVRPIENVSWACVRARMCVLARARVILLSSYFFMHSATPCKPLAFCLIWTVY